MPAERPDLLIGRRAVERGWLPEDALAAAVARQENDVADGLTVRGLGALLIEAGALTPAQVAELQHDQAPAAVPEEDALLGTVVARKAPASAAAVDDPSLRATLVTQGRRAPQGDPQVSADADPAQLDTLPSGDVASLPTARRFGRYELRSELGSGGMGKVYRAWDPGLNREVALKVLLLGDRADRDAIDRFQREARAAAGLAHPGIVPVYEVGEVDGKPYYTMELVQGKELADLARDGAISPREAIEIVRQVAEALRFAHARGVLHRDIKPRNVFVQRDGASLIARVIDFGLAKFSEDEVRMDAGSKTGASLRSLTQAGEMLGTPLYMSPEQFAKAAEVDGRADVYSLGATLYELFTGAPPFAGAATLLTLFHSVQDVEPDPPRKRVPDLDIDAETICLKCLHKAPADRYAGAGALADDCRRFLAGEEIAARPVGWLGRQWKRAKRNKVVAIPLGVAVLVALMLVAYLTGSALSTRWQLAQAAGDARALLELGRFADARPRAQMAVDLAPGIEKYKDLLNRAQAGQKRTEGAQFLAAWRDGVQRTTDLEAAEKQANKEAETVQPAQRPALQERRWTIAKDLREALPKREDDWSAAVSRFTEATTWWREDEEARQVLAELYWHRFRQAEIERDRTNEKTYARLVQDVGGPKYRDLVRCERRVRVRFELPQAFAADTVVAYLYVHAQKDAPPVLVPVPADRTTGAPFDADDLLAKDIAFGRPIPLAAVAAARSASVPPALPAAELAALERSAGADVVAGRYAAALPAFDRLTRAVPGSVGHAYNLACCLAVGAREQDPAAWLAAGAGEEAVRDLARRMAADPTWTDALQPAPSRDRPGAVTVAWIRLALAALEESVRRGYREAGHAETDADLAALRIQPAFAMLLAFMRGDLPLLQPMVSEVVADSQAARLGVQPGDILLYIKIAGRGAGRVRAAAGNGRAGKRGASVDARGRGLFGHAPSRRRSSDPCSHRWHPSWRATGTGRLASGKPDTIPLDRRLPDRGRAGRPRLHAGTRARPLVRSARAAAARRQSHRSPRRARRDRGAAACRP